jgi:hypothetical protein
MHLLQRLLHALLSLRPRDIVVLIGIWTAITAWIIGIRMRRKIRRDLGRKATDTDLTSIDTWMKVDEVEEEKRRTESLKPE